MWSSRSWFIKHKKTKIAFIGVLLFLFIGSQLAKRSMNELDSFGEKEYAEVPQISHFPWDASKIYAITTYRSNFGHDYTFEAWDGETCRTMKHYVNYATVVNNETIRSQPTATEPNIKIYAPFDGIFTIVEPGIDPTNPTRKVLGVELSVSAASNSHWRVRISHSDALPGLKSGSHVKSGDVIGTIGPRDASEIAFEANVKSGAGKKVVYQSIFEHMTSEAFGPLAELGFAPNDFVLSREEADAMHYQCIGGGGWQLYVPSEPLVCETKCAVPGFIPIRPNPYEIAPAEG